MPESSTQFLTVNPGRLRPSIVKMRGAKIAAPISSRSTDERGPLACDILVFMSIGRIEFAEGFFGTLAAFIWMPFLPEKQRSAALKRYPINLDAAFLISTSLQLLLFLYLTLLGFLDYQEQMF